MRSSTFYSRDLEEIELLIRDFCCILVASSLNILISMESDSSGKINIEGLGFYEGFYGFECSVMVDFMIKVLTFMVYP